MQVRNKTSKNIGFGTGNDALILLPSGAEDGDDYKSSGTLPKGYGKDHPLVKYYLSKGWIEEVAPKAAPKKEEVEDETEAEDDAEDELALEIKAVAGMNQAKLREKATSLGIGWTVKESNVALVDKITAKLQGGA
jgi:hypothetical protein